MPLARGSVVGVLTLVGCGLTVPEPDITEISPAVLCDAEAVTGIQILGSGFTVGIAPLAAAPQVRQPAVTLRRAADEVGAADELVGRTVEVPEAAVSWRADGVIDLAIGPEAGLVPGLYDVIVANPGGGAAELPRALVVVAPPILTDVTPGAVCQEATTTILTVSSDGFYSGDTLPTVTFGAATSEGVAVDGCVPIGNGAGSLCASVSAEVAPLGLPLGPVTVTARNAEPAACDAIGALVVEVVAPVTAIAVTPDAICGDETYFYVTGTRFDAWTSVHVGGVRADVRLVDDESLEVTLGAGTPTGQQPVVVGLDSGCAVDVPGGIEVIEGPALLFVDPERVWNGMTTAVTAYLDAPPNPLVDIAVIATDGTRTSVAFEIDAGTPSVVKFTVPEGLPSGVYDVVADYAGGCDGTPLDAALVVTDTLGVSIDSVEPAYAWTYDFTAVEIRAADPLPTGLVGFEDPPLVYLSPTDPTEPGFPLRAVTFRDAGRLTAVLPDGLALGTYDVVVVNPDGLIGVLPEGVTVVADPPPEIVSVSPPSLPKNGDGVIEILGSEFRDPAVSLTCRSAGVESVAVATVTAWSLGSITAVVPVASFNEAVCVVTVTNGDGPYALFSAISIRNPAENLFPWSAGTEMVEARRAPAAVAGRTNAISRYVYAFGGDTGTTSGARATMERAPVGPFGDLDEWALLDTGLPSARTLAAAVRIGRFVYVIGGSDGSTSLSSVIRAKILNPVDVPHMEGITFDTDAASGPGAGRWTYRVAALYPSTDLSNPDGESLASEPFTLRVPERADPIAVSVSWRPVDGASGYRVYRSESAGDPVGDEVWVADVTDATFTDDGAAPDPALVPLLDGALGVWVDVPSMGTARRSPCAVVAADPSTDPVVWHVFVAGGADGSGNALASIEELDVTVVDAETQLAGTWDKSARALSVAREQCGAYAVSSDLHSTVPDDETWVYFVGGLAAKKATGVADAGEAQPGGTLGSWQTVDTMAPARAGFGAAAASDFLYAFGGHGGSPSASGTSAEIDAVPTLQNWNSLGVSLTDARYLAGSAQESALILQVGGQTDTAAASRTTDVTSY